MLTTIFRLVTTARASSHRIRRALLTRTELLEENDRLRRALESNFVFERVYGAWDYAHGDVDRTEGWECALCEAAGFASREAVIHTHVCPLYEGPPSPIREGDLS